MPAQPEGGWAEALAPLQIAAREEIEYLWPENVEAWQMWQAVQTQWRVGVAGATGLDYAGVRAALDEHGIEPGERRMSIWSGIVAAERAVLAVWAERRQKGQ